VVIRREQIDAMYEQRRDESEQSFVTYFRHTMPENVRALDDMALRARIRQGIDDASGYGIVGGRPLVQFLALSLVIAPNFCEEPAVARYLRTPNANMEAKLDLLTNLVCARLRNLE
jgi:hypothetical protein